MPPHQGSSLAYPRAWPEAEGLACGGDTSSLPVVVLKVLTASSQRAHPNFMFGPEVNT